MKKIAIGCDPNAQEQKQDLIGYLAKLGYDMVDLGSDDPIYAHTAFQVARGVADGTYDRGILLCGTGLGMSIAANKVKGIRCALLSDKMSARLTRQHNDTNMMALGAGVVGPMLAMEIVDTWLDTAFEGGRHQRRIDKVMALEQE